MGKDLKLFNDFWNDFPTITDSLKSGFLNKFPEEFNKILNGRCDFEELDDKYIVELEVPGVKKDEINISLKNDVLSISWSRKKETKSGKGKSRYERSEGSFTRSFDVAGADSSHVDASLKDGILKLTIPKLENYKPKQIEIK